MAAKKAVRKTVRRKKADALLARAEAAERDAGRYRWLRVCANEDAVIEMQDWNEDGPTDTYYEKRGAELDAAIDAAMKSEISAG